MEAGMVYFPIDAVWLDDLETELSLFPNGAHDDQVDALSYAAVHVQRSAGPVPINR
jgi:predicted phage terminase large subunit-like protein